ncbi:hypothetical protein KHA90_06375 [Flavobacterium psychroterrae]|uniref:HTH LytTR-type domain-containing protein n=1 Tax=Flavobacterium psychroterrae TaxID=2133767 RepID=A0ABS5P8K0_9FLAO|nr:hypothetical protein [Flavobacterium psychroterrae]MBS7230643.1 hypothetical protein [Flavobacterium psychroterrae]
MKSINVTRGKYDYVIFLEHIISVSSSNVENETYIRVTNGDSILVEGSLNEIVNKINKAKN